MKKFFLAFLLLVSGLTATHSQGSGSDSVLLQVGSKQYVLTNAIREIEESPVLFDFLETFMGDIYLARVTPSVFGWVSYRTTVGIDVVIEFENYESVTFRYYPFVDTIMGFNSKGELLILAQ